MNTYLWYEKKNMKQLIKKIMVLFVMLFLFTGCINNKNDKKNKNAKKKSPRRPRSKQDTMYA